MGQLKKLLLGIFSFCFLALTGQVRDETLLDSAWRFCNVDIENAEKSGFDDSQWERVTIPHDWAIRGTFDMNLDTQVIQVVEDGDQRPLLEQGELAHSQCLVWAGIVNHCPFPKRMRINAFL